MLQTIAEKLINTKRFKYQWFGMVGTFALKRYTWSQGCSILINQNIWYNYNIYIYIFLAMKNEFNLLKVHL